MLGRGARKEKFAQIPYGLDMLVAHSPLYGIGDRNMEGEHCGCLELRAAVAEKKPRFVVYGHIHEGYRDLVDRRFQFHESLVCHVSLLSSSLDFLNRIRVFEL